MLLYSGHVEENSPYTQGVALMLSKEARKPLIGWESYGSRITKPSFKTKNDGMTVNVIQCYVPTNDSNDDDKDRFYERLQSIMVKCSRKNLIILVGDLNAKVGMDNTGYEDIMGRHRLTGKKGREWFQALQDLLEEEETTMGDNWKGIKETLTSTCQEVLSHNKHHHKEWISIDSLDKNQEKDKKKAIDDSRTIPEKAKVQTEYTESVRSVKRGISADRQECIEYLAITAEKLQMKEI
ncbi:unnamed protein product [Schistosoma curassoni]|uniref:Endo/exonuclease/phosphatase domain-containing protein n=1 Tax=Schistosoma curassoni TaxID=6186 RepID=A0A183KD78_9TREM|nr:unnamed protein product [Schistosoma curassoni]